MSRTKFHFYFRTTQFSSHFFPFSINAFLCGGHYRCGAKKKFAKLLTKWKSSEKCNLQFMTCSKRVRARMSTVMYRHYLSYFTLLAQFTHKIECSQRNCSGKATHTDGINEWMNQNRTIKMTSEQTQWLHHNHRHRLSHTNCHFQSMRPCERCASFFHFLFLFTSSSSAFFFFSFFFNFTQFNNKPQRLINKPKQLIARYVYVFM